VTLVDSNVLIDIFAGDANWFDWSSLRIVEAAANGALAINAVIYAEASIRYRTSERFDAALAGLEIEVLPLPPAALFLAGKTFARYRGAGGVRTGVLPDFFIGAHAEIAGLPILTRDTRRYLSYFPTVTLIAPDAT
jgi:predicted nucleic acid-binding protein